ncbi:MAG: lysophospholipid acyltransferase family protein [Elusimicrobiota bacterium]
MKVFAAMLFFSLYLRFMGRTTGIKYYGRENIPRGGYIYVFWHNRLAFLAYSHRARAINVLLSTSSDGEIIWRVLKLLGFRGIRGTASNPSQARRSTVAMLRALKEKKVIAITPDGPKGPPLEVKKGVPYIARKSGCPVVPLSYAVKRKKIINSWDSLILPLPFNRAAVVTGEPYYVDKKSDIEEERKKIATIIEETNRKAQELL